MSRKPHDPIEPEVLPGEVPGHAITLSEEQATRDIERAAAFDAARLLGNIEAARFSALCAEKVIVETFLKLKQNKAYRAIEVRDADGNLRRCADLEEFCERFLGASYRKVKELTDNYHLVGADLFEQAERMGFKRNDYRALKALPADDQDAIKAAMQTDDRDQVLDLMQELAVRHASEKAALKAQTTEAEETAAARDDVIKAKEATISRLELRAASAERRQADFTDIEARDYECAPLHDTINETMVAMLMMATQVKRLVEEVGGELVTEECFHAVLLPIKRALEIAAHNGLHIDLATLFDEEATAATESLQARAAGLTPGALQ